MSINLIFKIAAVGILVSILSQVLKHSGREEQAFLTSLAGLILVLSWVLPRFMTYFLRSGNCFLFKEGGTELNSIQIALFGVVGTLLALQFKSGKSEYGIYVSLAVSLFLFLCMLSRLEIFVRTVKKIADYIKLDAGQMSILLKMAGVTYVAEFASGICKDAGYQNIAVQIEIFTKLTILAIGMPVLLALLELIGDFLI